MMPFKTTTISFLYDNPIGKYLLNEDGYSLCTGFRNPYKKGVITLAEDDPDLDEDPNRAKYVRSIPRSKIYKGLLLQGYMVSPRFMKSLEKFQIRPDDLFIISYPRSGTTWTEELVSAIFSKFDKSFMEKQVHERVFHLEVGRPYGQKGFLNSLKSPRLLGTHLPVAWCPPELRQLKCKVIYVLRNPKDQAVSYYHFHQTAKYLGGEKRDWDEFLQLYLKGHLVYGSWFEHVKGWIQLAQTRPDKVMVISYEELQVDLLGMTNLISEFIGRNLTEETINKIVEHCSFSQMKDNKSVNREDIPLKDCFQTSQKKFMRKGIIGDWKNHFTPEQSEAFDQVYREKMKHVNLKIAYDREEAEAIMASSPDNRIISRHSSLERLITGSRVSMDPSESEEPRLVPVVLHQHEDDLDADADDEQEDVQKEVRRKTSSSNNNTGSDDNNNEDELPEKSKSGLPPFDRMFPIPLSPYESAC